MANIPSTAPKWSLSVSKYSNAEETLTVNYQLDASERQKYSALLEELTKNNQRVVLFTDGSASLQKLKDHQWADVRPILSSNEDKYHPIVEYLKAVYIKTNLAHRSRTDKIPVEVQDVEHIAKKIDSAYKKILTPAPPDFLTKHKDRLGAGNDVVGLSRNAAQIPKDVAIAKAAAVISSVASIYFFQGTFLRIFQGIAFIALAWPRFKKGLETLNKTKTLPDGLEKEKLLKRAAKDLIIGAIYLTAGAFWIMLGTLGFFATTTVWAPLIMNPMASILFWVLFNLAAGADILDGMVSLSQANKYSASLNNFIKGAEGDEKKRKIVQWVQQKIKPDIAKILKKDSVKNKEGEKKATEIKRLIQKKTKNKYEKLSEYIDEKILKIIIENPETDADDILAKANIPDIEKAVKKLSTAQLDGWLLILGGVLCLIGNFANFNQWRELGAAFLPHIQNSDTIGAVFWVFVWLWYIFLDREKFKKVFSKKASGSPQPAPV